MSILFSDSILISVFILNIVIIIIVRLMYKREGIRKAELSKYKKKNKTKFKTYSQYQKHIQKIEDIEWEKDQKKIQIEKKAEEGKQKLLEAKRLKEEQLEEKRLELEKRYMEKRERKSTSIQENTGGNLINEIKRLKILYNKGTLTKAEFEKAKNKLLK